MYRTSKVIKAKDQTNVTSVICNGHFFCGVYLDLELKQHKNLC